MSGLHNASGAWLLGLALGGLVSPLTALAAPLVPTVPVEAPVDGSPEAVAALVVQQVMPALEGRKTAAVARTAAARAYFVGQSGLATAFPELHGQALEDAALIEARLQRLDDRGAARSAARIAPLPELPAAQSEALRLLLTETLDAEDTAATLERRFLLALRQHLEEHPGLSRRGLAPERARLERAIAQSKEKLEAALPADRPAARRELASLEEERIALERLVTALQRVASVAGAELPDPSADIARMGESAGARARLERLAPFLSDEQRALIAAGEAAWVQTAKLPRLQQQLSALKSAPLPEGDAAAMRGALPVLEAEFLAAERTAAALGADLPEPTAEAQVARVERALAQLRLTKVEARLNELEASGGGQGVRARIEAERAAQAAQEARDAAAAALDEELVNALVAAKERTQEAWDHATELRERQEVAAREQAAIVSEVSERAASARGGLLVAGQQHVDTVYAELRVLLTEQRETVESATRRVGEELAEISEMTAQVGEERVRLTKKRSDLSDDAETRTEQRATLTDWEDALEARLGAAEAARAALVDERADAVRTLTELRDIRRSLARRVSSSALAEDDRLDELQHEIALLDVQVRTMASGRVSHLLSLPARLLDLPTLWRTFSNGFYLVLLIGLWGWGRDSTKRLAGALLVRVREIRPDIKPVDLHNVRGPLSDVLRRGLDLAVGLLVLGPLWENLPELGLLVLIWLHVVCYRLLLHLFDLALPSAENPHPSPWTLNEDDHQMGRMSVRWLGIWWVSRRLTWLITHDVVGTDALSGVLDDLFWWVGLGLVVRLLHSWEPLLRKRVGSLQIQQAWVERLAKGPPQSFIQAPWALGHLLLLAMRLAWALLLAQADRSETLGQALNVLTRYRFAQKEAEEAGTIPSAETLAQICEVLCADDAFLPRPEADAAFEAEVQGWRQEKRRGLIAVVGDRGGGKRTWLDRQEERLRSSDGHVVRVTFDERVMDKAALFDFLHHNLGVPQCEHTEEMGKALNALKPGIYILEASHFAFLRAVGGLEAMRRLLYLLNDSSQEHLWVLVMHRPAWRYLQRLGGLMDTGVMRAVVDLPPLAEHDLRELTLRRARRMTKTVDFSGLVRPSALGGDPEIELERTTDQFYRLLAEASSGNASAALEMFARCLRQESDGRWSVTMDDGLGARPPEGLSETDLFVLTALRTHDELDVGELVRVLNIGPGSIRNTVKSLESRGLAERHKQRVRIPVHMQPSVTRALRRRHFLQWAV